MPKKAKKRKSNENGVNKSKSMKVKSEEPLNHKKVDHFDDVDEMNDENSINEFNNDESQDEDEDWEDVSDREEIIEIDLNNNDNIVPKKNTKKDESKQQRDHLELLHRTNLMCLIARLIYVNEKLQSSLIKNVLFSILTDNFDYVEDNDINEIKELIEKLIEIFDINNSIPNHGVIQDILSSAASIKTTSNYWLNIIIVGLLQIIGYKARIIAIMYPGPLKLTDLNEKKNSGILKNPTVYKPSTRGNSKKSKTKSKQESRHSLDSENKITDEYPMYFFAEVLLPKTLRWVPFNASDMTAWNSEKLIVKKYPRFLYALSIHQDGFIRNVAVRYDPHWCTTSRKMRLNEISFNNILEFRKREKSTEFDLIEDKYIKELLSRQPIPITFTEFKGHPVYVLEKDMLKYEVLNPNTKSISTFKNQAVYLRENISTAHTADTWLKKAMSVKEGEEPCKRVKTIMSRRREKNGRDPYVDLWGPWQVENYRVPVASDGIVPINRHGNVYLFKPNMLPHGCVHIQGLFDIDKVCKQLNIHCAPAMIGWTFTKCNSARPILDGWVVCRENVQTIKEAWIEYTRDKIEKDNEKRSARAIKNWRIIMRRLFLRERLRRDYNM